MKPRTKFFLKEVLVRKNQLTQRLLSQRTRLGLRVFLSLPRRAQLWLTKKSLRQGFKKLLN